MPLVPFTDILEAPYFSTLPHDEKLKVTENYWKNAAAEDPQPAQDVAQTDATATPTYHDQQYSDSLRLINAKEKLKDATPIQARFLNQEVADSSTALVVRQSIKSGDMTFDEGVAFSKQHDTKGAPEAEGLQKTLSLFTPEVDKAMQPSYDAMAKSAIEGNKFGSLGRLGKVNDAVSTFLPGGQDEPIKVAAENYDKLRDTFAEDFKLKPDEVDDIMLHRMDLQKDKVSRDVTGQIHIKNDTLDEGADAISKAVEESSLPQSVKDTFTPDVVKSRVDGFKSKMVERVKNNTPDLYQWMGLGQGYEEPLDDQTKKAHPNAPDPGTHLDQDYAKIRKSINDSRAEQGTEGFIGGLDRLAGTAETALGALSEGFSLSTYLPENSITGPQYVSPLTERAAVVEKRVKMRSELTALSHDILKDKLEILGTDAATIGQGVYSGVESMALMAATSGLGNVVMPAARVAEMAGVAKWAAKGVAAAADIAPMSTIYGVDDGQQVYHQAIAAGKTPTEAAKLGTISGVTETGITMLSSALHMGGTEHMGAELLRPEFREAVNKSVKKAWLDLGGKVVLGVSSEQLEENTITLLKELNVQSKLNKQWTINDLGKALHDTATATLFASGPLSLVHGVTEEGKGLLQATHEMSDEDLHAAADAVSTTAALEDTSRRQVTPDQIEALRTQQLADLKANNATAEEIAALEAASHAEMADDWGLDLVGEVKGPDGKPISTAAAPTLPPPNGFISPEASAFLTKIDEGQAVPVAMNDDLEKLAKDNGIEVIDETEPQDLVDALREKAPAPAVAPASKVGEDVVTLSPAIEVGHTFTSETAKDPKLPIGSVVMGETSQKVLTDKGWFYTDDGKTASRPMEGDTLVSLPDSKISSQQEDAPTGSLPATDTPTSRDGSSPLVAKRAADFSTSGTYEVETPSGVRRIFRDPESGAWLDVDRRPANYPHSPFPNEFLGYTKEEALKALADEVKNETDSSPATPPTNVENQQNPETSLPVPPLPTGTTAQPTPEPASSNTETATPAKTEAETPLTPEAAKPARKKLAPLVRQDSDLVGARRAIGEATRKRHNIAKSGLVVEGFTEKQLLEDSLADIAEADHYDNLTEDEKAKAPLPPRTGRNLVEFLLGAPDTHPEPRETALLVYETIQAEKAVNTARKRVKDSSNPNAFDIKAHGDALDYLQQVLDLLQLRGSKAGLALRAYKMVANRQFEPAIMASDYFAWKNQGKERADWVPVTGKEHISLEAESARIKDLLEKMEQGEAARRESIAAQEHLQHENLMLKSELEKSRAAKTRKAPVRQTTTENSEQRSQTAREKLMAFGATFTAPGEGPSLLDRMADRARQNIRERSTRTSALVDPTVLLDVAIIAAQHIKNGLKTLAEVTVKLVTDLGEDFRKYAEPAFNKAQENITSDVGEESILDSLTDIAANDVLNGLTDEQIKEKLAEEFGDNFGDLIDSAVAGARDRLKKTAAGSRAKSPRELASLIDPDKGLSRQMVYNMYRGLLAQNLRGKDVVNAILKLVNPTLPEVTYNDVVDAFTSYGKVKFPSKEEIDLLTRRERRRLLIERQIGEILNGKLPKLTGFVQDKADPSNPADQMIRHLTKDRNQLLRDMKLTGATERTQMRGSLDAIKTKFKNDIEELTNAMAENRKLPNRVKNVTVYDTELKNLKAQKNELIRRYNAVWGRTARQETLEQRLKAADKALDKSIALEEKMALEGALKRPAPESIPRTPTMIAKAKELKALQDARHTESRRLAREAKELLNPPKSEKQRQTETLERQVQAAIDRFEYYLKHGKFPDSTGKPTTFERDTFPVDLLRIKEDLAKAVAVLRADARPLSSLQQTKKNREVTQLENLRDALETQINSKSWDKTATAKSSDPRADALRETVKILQSIKERTQKLDPNWIASTAVKWNESQAKQLQKNIERFEYFLKHNKYPAKADGTTYTKEELVKDLIKTKNSLKDQVAAIQKENRKKDVGTLANLRRASLIKSLNKVTELLEKQITTGFISTGVTAKEHDAEINAIKEINKGLRESITKLRKADPYWIASHEQKLNDAAIRASEARTAKWEQRLRDGNFSDDTKINREPSKELKRQRFLADKAKTDWLQKRADLRLKNSSPLTRIGHAALGVSEVSNLIVLGLDFIIGRQGLLGLVTNPRLFAKGWFKALTHLTEQGEHEMWNELNDPEFTPVISLIRQAGNKQWKLFAPNDVNSFINKEDMPRPELLNHLAKIPVVGKLAYPIVWLERINRIHSNVMAVDAATGLLSPEGIFGIKDPSKNDINVAVNSAMISIRRGSLANQNLDAGAALLNLFFISSRYMYSGLQYSTFQPVWTSRGGYRGTLKMRARVFTKTYLQVMFTASIVATVLGRIAFGDDEEKWKRYKNPLDSRFLVLTFNGVEYKFLQALTPHISILAKLAFGYKVTDKGIVPLRGEGSHFGQTADEEWDNFLKNRRSLRYALAIDIVKGKHYDGSNVTILSVIKKMTTNINFTNDMDLLESQKPGTLQKAVTIGIIHAGFSAQVEKDYAQSRKSSRSTFKDSFKDSFKVKPFKVKPLKL